MKASNLSSSPSFWVHQLLELFDFQGFYLQMGVSKNTDTPKWMVYNGKPY